MIDVKEAKELAESKGFTYMDFFCTYQGGHLDGEMFLLVRNEKEVFWISNSRPGRFRSVFVPIDFKHPLIIP
jgi:hypothetical protein